MRILFLLFLCPFLLRLDAQSDGNSAAVAEYLESIRDDKAYLTAFFANMPKGGDLHHHFEGSIYPETMVEAIVRENYWIDPETLAIFSPGTPVDATKCVRIATLASTQEFPALRRKLLQKWSIVDYQFSPSDPPDVHFFGAFPAFIPAIPAVTDEGLLKMKARAIAENVQYLETIFLSYQCSDSGFSYPPDMDAELRTLQEHRDEKTLFRVFDKLYEELEAADFSACADEHNAEIERRHDSLGIDDDNFHLRYQNYVLRVLPPTVVFADLAINFLSASRSPLVVGVNIVAPEHDPVALSDYWLHMQMYRYLSGRFPRVQKALHAGELVAGQVRPEDLNHHINEAVAIAGADRIGHGIDIPFESNHLALLERMANESIAVEINLESSRFILGLPPAQNPITIYLKHGVPIVISSDDAGVLRTSLTMQYVVLAGSFPKIGYEQIKEMVFNSINYSFIEEAEVKAKVLQQLEGAFATFEQEWAKAIAP